MGGNGVAIFSKAPDGKPLFLLKIKIIKKPGCPNKEYNAVFEQIYQNVGAYPRCKKICIDYYLSRRVRAKRGIGEQVWFVPNTFWGFQGQCHTREIWLFLVLFKLENSIPTT